VTAERRREQAVGEQRVRGATDRDQEQAVHHAEERQLEQRLAK
jgi:hypothetical protein